jgi:hypothetical protein
MNARWRPPGAHVGKRFPDLVLVILLRCESPFISHNSQPSALSLEKAMRAGRAPAAATGGPTATSTTMSARTMRRPITTVVGYLACYEPIVNRYMWYPLSLT